MSLHRKTRLRRRRLLSIGMAAVLVAAWPAVTSGTASAAFTPALNCPAEQFPAAGSPRSSTPAVPYKAPFAATLNGGSLAVSVPGALAGVTFGAPQPGYPNGTLFGEACGVLTLPSLTGPIAGNPYGAPAGNTQYNNNFILHGPPACDLHYQSATAQTPVATNCNQSESVPVGLTFNIPGTNVSILSGYGSADGVIAAEILPQAAANGGFNISFSTTAKATAVITPTELAGLDTTLTALPTSVLKQLSAPVQAALSTLSGLFAQVAPNTEGECTLAIGDLTQTGLPAGDIPGGDPGPFTQPVTLSTAVAKGQPVTGPISSGLNPVGPGTAGRAVAYSNTFPVPPVSSAMPPDPAAPGADTTAPATLCSPTVAQIFNTVLGLGTAGAPAGSGVFDAPVTFSAHVTQ